MITTRAAAVLTLVAGAVLLAARSADSQVAEESSVPLVKVYVTVRGEKDAPVSGLVAGDFTLMEDGKRQEISFLSQDVLPLKLAIVLDCSESMSPNIENARVAARLLLRKLAPDDQALVIGFGDGIRAATELTSDRDSLSKTVDSLWAHGGTALYDALHMAVLALRGHEGKRAIVLLSDGKDEAWGGGRPGSRKTFEDVSDEIARSQIALYPICFGRVSYATEFDVERKRTLKDVFETMSGVSGGRCIYTQSGTGLADSFLAILTELKTQYDLYYTPSDREMDGRWREITVVVNRPVRSILHRKGYYAVR